MVFSKYGQALGHSQLKNMVTLCVNGAVQQTFIRLLFVTPFMTLAIFDDCPANVAFSAVPVGHTNST